MGGTPKFTPKRWLWLPRSLPSQAPVKATSWDPDQAHSLDCSCSPAWELCSFQMVNHLACTMALVFIIQPLQSHASFQCLIKTLMVSGSSASFQTLSICMNPIPWPAVVIDILVANILSWQVFPLWELNCENANGLLPGCTKIPRLSKETLPSAEQTCQSSLRTFIVKVFKLGLSCISYDKHPWDPQLTGHSQMVSSWEFKLGTHYQFRACGNRSEFSVFTALPASKSIPVILTGNGIRKWSSSREISHAQIQSLYSHMYLTSFEAGWCMRNTGHLAF